VNILVVGAEAEQERVVGDPLARGVGVRDALAVEEYGEALVSHEPWYFTQFYLIVVLDRQTELAIDQRAKLQEVVKSADVQRWSRRGRGLCCGARKVG
jgi:hypothetical protein